MDNSVYIGTCSWKYPSWKTFFYEGDEVDDYLGQYARHYRTVEIDQWFYSLGKSEVRLPDRTTVDRYNEQTPPSFRFTIKAPNALTSPFAYGSKSEFNPWFLSADLLYQFLEHLAPLGEKCAMILLQFPYLNRQAVAERALLTDRLAAFGALMPDSIDIAIEVRNPRWIDRSWFELLYQAGLSPVILSGYWMDNFLESVEAAIQMGFPSLCIRLHGEDRGEIERITNNEWDKIVLPKDEEITGLAQLLKGIESTVFLNINNHYEGSAPLTIARLKEIWEKL